MSFKAMVWAFDQTPQDGKGVKGPTQKLVLLALANYANVEDRQTGDDTGVQSTYVSTRTLMRDTGYGERTVRRAIDALTAQGLLGQQHRRRQNGSFQSSLYVLSMRALDPPVTVTDGEPQATVASGQIATSPTDAAVASGPQVTVAPLEPQATSTPTPEPQALALRAGEDVSVSLVVTSKKRPPDPLWEAFLTVCNIDPASLSKDRRGRLNGMVSNLRKLGATPEEVYLRAMNWAWDVPMTDFAFVKHWADLAQPYRPKPDASDRMLVQARIDEAQAQRRREEGARDERDRGDARLPEAPHVLPGGPRDAAGHRGELRGAVPEVPHGARR